MRHPHIAYFGLGSNHTKTEADAPGLEFRDFTVSLVPAGPGKERFGQLFGRKRLPLVGDRIVDLEREFFRQAVEPREHRLGFAKLVVGEPRKVARTDIADWSRFSSRS